LCVSIHPSIYLYIVTCNSTLYLVICHGVSGSTMCAFLSGCEMLLTMSPERIF